MSTPTGPAARGPGHAAPRATWPQRALRRWRVWLPALSLALLCVVVTQDMDDWLIGHVPYLWYVVISRALGTTLLVIPLLLYYSWRRAAQRQAEARQAVEAAIGLRDDLAHMLVHDLKSPLTSAGMALNLLARLAATEPRDPGKEQRMLSMARDDCRRMEHLVQDILDVARTEAGQFPLDLAPADVIEPVRQAVYEVGPLLHERSLCVAERYAPGPVLATVDSDKLHRVVSNLLDNAIKFSPEGGEIEVEITDTATEVRIAVRDNGEGIPPELRERIFDKFRQGAGAERVARRSVGLGLTFCKLAVEAHGGRIWVDSAPGGGSLFVFTLPRSEPGDNGPAAGAAGAVSGGQAPRAEGSMSAT
jgi:signal transduction histidine kinase